MAAPTVAGISSAFRPDAMEAVSTGTSIMACEFNGGVIIGADSRTSSGAYITNRVTDKLTQITDRIYCCRSGSAADTQAIADVVSYHLEFFKMETGTEPLVETAASLFQELCYTYRDQYTAGIIVAGWDNKKGGQVYMIPVGGLCQRMKCAMGGSGSTYVYGYSDAQFKEDMSLEECKTFVAKTLSLAMTRDGGSGGVIRLGVIAGDKDVDREIISGDAIPKCYTG